MTEFKPPAHLSREAKGIWRRLTTEYRFDPDDHAGLLILATSLEAYDRMRTCQKEIKEHGLMLVDRHEQRRPNGAVAAERDARAAWLAGLKSLNLDAEPPRKR